MGWAHTTLTPPEAVKPSALMRWLVRLVTPPGGTVLDPFVGSGSTLVAAVMEGVSGIGIDLDAQYVAIAKRRSEAATLPLLSLGDTDFGSEI